MTEAELMVQRDELLDILDEIYALYETGDDCYEVPEEYSGYIGKAIKLNEAIEEKIIAVLNEYKPRNRRITS